MVVDIQGQIIIMTVITDMDIEEMIRIIKEDNKGSKNLVEIGETNIIIIDSHKIIVIKKE